MGACGLRWSVWGRVGCWRRRRRWGIAAQNLDELVLALQNADPDVRIHAVRELEELGDPAGILPMYDLVQDPETDLSTRHAAAEALVTLGLLRRRRVGASRPFLWLVAMALAIVVAAAVDTLGVAGAIVLFFACAAGLVAYYRWAARKERESGTYTGPDGATIQIPPIKDA